MKDWDEAVAYALSLPGSELSTSYGKPAVKLADNGRAFLFTGREGDTSFAVAYPLDGIEMLVETDPETFWQTPHYQGWQAVLVRFDSRDPERVRAVVEQSHEWSARRPPVTSRSKR